MSVSECCGIEPGAYGGDAGIMMVPNTSFITTDLRPTVTVHANDISHGLVNTQPSMQSHIKAFMAPKFLEFDTLFLTNLFNSCCPFSLWFVLENIYWGYLGHISSVRSNDRGANFENLNPSKHLVYAPTLNHWMNWKARKKKKSKTKVFELNDTNIFTLWCCFWPLVYIPLSFAKSFHP